MARTRDLKPGFFMNEDLAQLDPYARLLFAGLWTIADRDGRLLDKPMRIKAQVLPYNDVDVDRLLADLATAEFIERYQAGDIKAIQIVNFDIHQRVHPKETASGIPSREKVRQCNSFSNTSPEKNSKGRSQAIEVDPEDPDLKKEKKIPKEKSGAELYKLPDSGGNERVPHPEFPELWLSGPEVGKLHILFHERGLRKEFHRDAFETVATWFTESKNGRKDYPDSRCHARRIATIGLDGALKAQSKSDNTKAAEDRAAEQEARRAEQESRRRATTTGRDSLRAALMAPEEA